MSKLIRALDSSVIKGVPLAQISSETVNNFRLALKIVSPLVTIPFSSNATWNIDNFLFTNGQITLSGNSVLRLVGMPSVCYGTLIVKQNSIGNHQLELPGIGDKEILTAPLSESWIDFTYLDNKFRWGMGRGLSL